MGRLAGPGSRAALAIPRRRGRRGPGGARWEPTTSRSSLASGL